jgi:hypothetical protein
MPQELGTFTSPAFESFRETRTSPSISSNSLTLDLNNGNIFIVNLNANITTLTISNPPSSQFSGNFTIIFTADGTPRSVLWPPSIKWSTSVPTLTSTNGKRDILNFITYDGGTNWYANIGGQNL